MEAVVMRCTSERGAPWSFDLLLRANKTEWHATAGKEVKRILAGGVSSFGVSHNALGGDGPRAAEHGPSPTISRKARKEGIRQGVEQNENGLPEHPVVGSGKEEPLHVTYMAGLKRLQAGEPVDQAVAMTAHDMKQLIDSIPHWTDKLVLRLAWITASRWAEIQLLTTSHFRQIGLPFLILDW
eukprot:gene10789-biopygen7711